MKSRDGHPPPELHGLQFSGYGAVRKMPDGSPSFQYYPDVRLRFKTPSPFFERQSRVCDPTKYRTGDCVLGKCSRNAPSRESKSSNRLAGRMSSKSTSKYAPRKRTIPYFHPETISNYSSSRPSSFAFVFRFAETGKQSDVKRILHLYPRIQLPEKICSR